MIYSKYQEAIFDWVKNASGSLVVEAVAGSGKSTTIIKAMEFAKGKVCSLAFNKAIADEMKSKVPRGVKVCTMHSLGLASTTSAFGSVDIDSKKLDRILKKLDFTFQEQVYARRIIPLLKNSLIDPKQTKLVEGLIDEFNIEVPIENCDEYKVLAYLPEIMEKNNQMVNIIDFDDMIYLPVVLGLGFQKFDWVFVDEAQDLNPTQMKMLEQIEAKHYVCVGDRRQAIYRFRGAVSDCLDKLKERFKADELPLSICYRCPTSHIKLAQQIVPQIEAREGAGEGLIQEISSSKMGELIQDGDMALCRMNAPLVGQALNALKEGKRAFVKGKDMGRLLVTLVKKIRADTLERFMERADILMQKEIAEAEVKERDTEVIKDKFACLAYFVAASKSVQEITDQINALFADNEGKGIEFSTVHRAKGLEADRVFILVPSKLGQAWGDQEQQVQEQNIKYVALTRAKKELYFVQ